jgi:hypothetical protein
MRVSARSCLTVLICWRVLDGLRFVKHHQSPRCGPQPGCACEKTVARDDQVDIRQIVGAVRRACLGRRRRWMNHDRFEAWGKSGNLGGPVVSSEAGATRRQDLRDPGLVLQHQQ